MSSGGPIHGQACIFRGIQRGSGATRCRAGLLLFQGLWAVGIGETALRRWVAQWRATHSLATPSPAQLSAEARRIKELEARVAELEREREVLKKIHGLLRQGAGSLMEVIQAMEKG